VQSPSAEFTPEIVFNIMNERRHLKYNNTSWVFRQKFGGHSIDSIGSAKILGAKAANLRCLIRNLSPSRAIQNKIPLALWRGKDVKPDDNEMLRFFLYQAWMAQDGKNKSDLNAIKVGLVKSITA